MKHLMIATVIASLSIFAMSAQANMEDWQTYDRLASYESITTKVNPIMRDGIALDCRMAVPAINGVPVTGQFPGIITNVTPYAAMNPGVDQILGYWARHGYQSLSCNVRGSGASGGYYPYNNSPDEWCDSYDLVEWMADQPGSNGRIGQEGTSYGGMTTYQAAIGNPPHLVAIAPQVAPNDLYLDDVYPGGVKKRPYVSDLWPLTLEMTTMGQIPAQRIWDEWLAHPTHDEFWDGIAIGPKLGRVNVPTLVVSGWDDALFRRGALKNYETLVQHGKEDTTWLLAGPWTHGFMFDTGICLLPGACVAEENRLSPGILLAWFDYWLMQNNDAPLPPSKVISYEGPQDSGRGYQMFDQWPPSDTTTLLLSLRQNGTMGIWPGLPGSHSFSQDLTSGEEGDIDHISFTTHPLQRDTVLAGDIGLTLKAQFSAPDANIHAELYEIKDGEHRLINNGWLKISHRYSNVWPTSVTPFVPVTAHIEIWPVHQLIPAGSQLMLKISGGGAIQVIPEDLVQTDVQTGIGGSTLCLTVRRNRR